MRFQNVYAYNLHMPPKVFIILLNWPSQLIHQYFTHKFVQISLFANISPLQNLPCTILALLILTFFIQSIEAIKPSTTSCEDPFGIGSDEEDTIY